MLLHFSKIYPLSDSDPVNIRGFWVFSLAPFEILRSRIWIESRYSEIGICNDSKVVVAWRRLQSSSVNALKSSSQTCHFFYFGATVHSAVLISCCSCTAPPSIKASSASCDNHLAGAKKYADKGDFSFLLKKLGRSQLFTD